MHVSLLVPFRTAVDNSSQTEEANNKIRAENEVMSGGVEVSVSEKRERILGKTISKPARSSKQTTNSAVD